MLTALAEDNSMDRFIKRKQEGVPVKVSADVAAMKEFFAAFGVRPELKALWDTFRMFSDSTSYLLLTYPDDPGAISIVARALQSSFPLFTLSQEKPAHLPYQTEFIASWELYSPRSLQSFMECFIRQNIPRAIGGIYVGQEDGLGVFNTQFPLDAREMVVHYRPWLQSIVANYQSLCREYGVRWKKDLKAYIP